jgi:hypothetical protein
MTTVSQSSIQLPFPFVGPPHVVRRTSSLVARRGLLLPDELPGLRRWIEPRHTRALHGFASGDGLSRRLSRLLQPQLSQQLSAVAPACHFAWCCLLRTRMPPRPSTMQRCRAPPICSARSRPCQHVLCSTLSSSLPTACDTVHAVLTMLSAPAGGSLALLGL